jgi:hypothetical protein
MKIQIAAYLLIIISCAGCGNHMLYWYNENNSYKQARQDCRDCIYQAQREAIEAAAQLSRDYGESFVKGYDYKQTLFDKCMKDRGYAEIRDDNLRPGIKKRIENYNDELYFIAGN